MVNWTPPKPRQWPRQAPPHWMTQLRKIGAKLGLSIETFLGKLSVKVSRELLDFAALRAPHANIWEALI
jgi:hypothetical protein